MQITNVFLKIRRKLIKKYIKFTHPRAEWNKAQFWPDVTTTSEHAFYRGQCIASTRLTELNKLANSALRACPIVNIVGSGPSVNDLDFKKIEGGVNIFLNGSISLAIKHGMPVFAHVILDPYFVFSRIDLLKNDLPQHNLILSPGAMCAIAERDISILNRNNVFVFNEVHLSEDKLFSNDIDRYVVDGGSVISVAMQFSAYTDAHEVRLLGLDIGNAGQPRFYETNGNVQRNCLMSDFEAKILPFMSAAAFVYQAQEIKLLNCSPISKLPYEIIPYWGGYHIDSNSN